MTTTRTRHHAVLLALAVCLALVGGLLGATGSTATTALDIEEPEVQQVERTVVLRALRVATYHVEKRGPLRASLSVFRRLTRETLEHPRGWRRTGTTFRRVARGGDFTLVLAEASWLPRFSSACSREWSCRVGRYVIINQTRWLRATPLWRSRGGTLRAYRHYVLNHELGHWLGLGHRACPGRGLRAPVMQAQSKGLDGCRINPWPRDAEVAAAR